jgi:hypothetical protein
MVDVSKVLGCYELVRCRGACRTHLFRTDVQFPVANAGSANRHSLEISVNRPYKRAEKMKNLIGQLNRSLGPSRFTRLGHALALLGLLMGSLAEWSYAAAPSKKQIAQFVSYELQQKANYQPGDLITLEDVKPILKKLAVAGKPVPNESKVVQDLLPANSALVKHLSSRLGHRFMRKVRNDKLIYDRLDRISRVNGGNALLRDLLKLPDGARYAKMDPGQAVPDLLDLLPKTRSGKTRTIKDYKKPTGRIYTEEDLVKRLVKSYEDAS